MFEKVPAEGIPARLNADSGGKRNAIPELPELDCRAQRAVEIASVNALGLYRECAGVVLRGNKMKPIAGAFPIQAIELSR
jgi:hypothetical protein